MFPSWFAPVSPRAMSTMKIGVGLLALMYTGRTVGIEPSKSPAVSIQETAEANSLPSHPTRQLAVASAGVEPGELRAAGLFRQHCSRCHDTDGSGARGRSFTPEIPNFKKQSWQERRLNEDLMASMQDGRGSHMPPFAGRITPRQMQELTVYIRSLGPRRPSPLRTANIDFDRRYRQLEQEWKELRHQFREMLSGQ